MYVELVEADRPSGDENEFFRKHIAKWIGPIRREDFAKFEFVCCDRCEAKSGTPELCVGCLANRETIRRLRIDCGKDKS